MRLRVKKQTNIWKYKHNTLDSQYIDNQYIIRLNKNPFLPYKR